LGVTPRHHTGRGDGAGERAGAAEAGPCHGRSRGPRGRAMAGEARAARARGGGGRRAGAGTPRRPRRDGCAEAARRGWVVTGRPRRARGVAGARDVVGRVGPSSAMAGSGAREEGGRGSRRGPRKKKRGENRGGGRGGGLTAWGGEGAGGRRFPGDGRAGRGRRVARGLEERERERFCGGEGRVIGGAHRGRRRRLQPPRAPRAWGAGGELGPRLGRAGGGGAGRGWEPAGPRLEVDQRGGRGKFPNLFISLFSHYSFPSNPLLSAYFMEIKQILTREIDAWFDMMQQPKKIFLGFTIITRHRVLEMGQV
jgi:hypothetical protein